MWKHHGEDTVTTNGKPLPFAKDQSSWFQMVPKFKGDFA